MRNVWIKEGDGTDKTDAAAVKKGAGVKKMGLIFRSLNLVAHCHLLLRTAHRKLSRNPPGTDITKKLKFAATLLPTMPTYWTETAFVESKKGF